MIDISLVKALSKPGDIIFTGGSGFLSRLIRNGQRTFTVDGKPSLWSHVLMYIDSDTVAESTMDYDQYLPTGKRMDNGPQFNDLSSIEDTEYGRLFCFDDIIGNYGRQRMLNRAACMIGSKGYRYDVTGLFGSLLTYYFLPWVKSNPLSGRHQLYCSAFISLLLNEIGLDPSEMTDRNTCPEMLSQWCRKTGMRERDLTYGEGAK